MRRRYVDIGDRVKEGQVLADIDAPDLDAQVAQERAALAQAVQQLEQAKAALENAGAQQDLAKVTWDRYKVLVPVPRSAPSPSSIGGIGTDLTQIGEAKYPTYMIGVQLSLPLRNRVAQADVARDEMQIRQWDIRKQQLENQIRLEVEASMVALAQARSTEVAARDVYAKARVQLQRAVGTTLEDNGITLDEAVRGRVNR